MPAHHSDVRYSLGLCLLARRRLHALSAAGASAAGPAAAGMLEGAAPAWARLAQQVVAAGAPEPWLQDELGVEWLQPTKPAAL